jgi:uncharacterized protein (TIGR02145 family)/uncharacterized repeat protein (TIGR02543 family)/prepilin-type N-terminal cleavage/methylation domain-containing protein
VLVYRFSLFKCVILFLYQFIKIICQNLMKKVLSLSLSRNYPLNKKSGFTLLEILLVVGIISILAGIVIVAINPSKQLATVRNTERKSDIKQISNALDQYYIDHNHYPNTVLGSLTEICDTGSLSTTTGSEIDCLDLIDLSVLVPTYLTAIPTDPQASTTSGAGYRVVKTSGKIGLSAPAELGQTIVIGSATTTTTTPTEEEPVPEPEAETYTVTFNTAGGSTAPSSITDITSGNTISLPTEPTKDGYTFSGWYTQVDGGGTNFTGSTDVTASITVYAGWEVIPWACGDILTDTRDSKTYDTVSIGTQCWMKQNLNVGTMVTGITTQTDNSSIEKYCYLDNESNCNTYGGLYQWNEMMGYSTSPGVQGICPTDWHIPTDTEYKTLVEGQATTGCESSTGWQCSPAGSRLSNLTLNHTNNSDFTALLAGYRRADGSFSHLSANATLWSSLQSGTSAWTRDLNSGYATVYRGTSGKAYGFSVRCLKD